LTNDGVGSERRLAGGNSLGRHYLLKNPGIGVWNFVADTTMLGQDTNAFKSVGGFWAMATIRGEEKGTRYEFKYGEK